LDGARRLPIAGGVAAREEEKFIGGGSGLAKLGRGGLVGAAVPSERL
jgi:hypothetical protein